MLELDPIVTAARQLAALVCPDGSGRCFTLVLVALVVAELVRRGVVKAPAAPQPVADQVGDVAAAEADARTAELLDVVAEAACHRYPDEHPDEALAHYVHDLRGGNYYHRGEARKKDAAAAAAAELTAGALDPTSYTSVDFAEVFKRIETNG